MFGTIERSTFAARSGVRAASVLAAAGLLTVAAAPSDAALIGNISFTTQTGVVGPTDAIDVYITMTLDPTSDALTTDAFHNITSGVTDSDWAAAGIDPSAIGYTYLNVFFQCGGTFGAGGCLSGPPYDFDFAPISLDPTNFDLQPGGSLSFKFGTFTPTGGGPVTPGTYTWYNMGIYAGALDANGDPFINPGDPDDPEDDREISITLFEACPYTVNGYDPACGFSRTVEGVAPVPEPASWAMMIGGFALAGGAMRRKRRVAVRYA